MPYVVATIWILTNNRGESFSEYLNLQIAMIEGKVQLSDVLNPLLL